MKWVILIMAVFWLTVGGLIAHKAKGADLPYEILHGHSRPTMALNKFGTYSAKYYQRRWKKLCLGGGRYVAMAEAYEQRKPSPCQ